MFCISSLAAAAQQLDGFPYPSVPDSLHTPDARTTWLVRHYWDGFNFADTTFLARPEQAEQGFVNFLDLLPRVGHDAVGQGLGQFVAHCMSGGAAVAGYFLSLADDYLADDSSPMRNDTLYARLLDAVVGCNLAPAGERMRSEYLSRNLRKNQPGTLAADFQYVDRQGHRCSLHDFRSRYTLLYFYDPDCDRCRQTLERLRGMPQLCRATHVRVLAIYPYGHDDRWATADTHFPVGWTDGYSPDGDIVAHDTYYIRSMPSIYLLDADKRVMLKNPDLGVLGKALGEMGE